MTRHVTKRVNLWAVLKTTVREYWKGDKFTLGAALAFYTVFSLAPMLVLMMAVAGLAFGEKAVEGRIGSEIAGYVGKEGAAQVERMIKAVAQTGHGATAALVSTALLVVGATSVFMQLRKSLNAVWEVRLRTSVGILKMLLDRVFAFAMVVCLGFLLILSLVIRAALVGIAAHVEGDFAQGVVPVLRVVEIAASFGLTALLFAIIYRFMSDARVRVRDAWAGALFTAVLFDLGKYAIGTYLGHTHVADTFGVAGSVVVLLLWVYYSSQIVFFGAEFTQALAAARGTHIVPGRHAVHLIHVGDEAASAASGGADARTMNAADDRDKKRDAGA
jgi:membrane protein